MSHSANNSIQTREKKINGRHHERLAVVYVRQSSAHQVQRHQESTQLQYGLVAHAERLGWPKERILVIDDDLGVSGASTEGRFGFQRLLSEVALDHVGVILGVEMSRLARSCKDWYQLLELCALFDTLICDLDGLYDPSCFNDRLLLGLKGTMSEAELHVLRQRMWQGALQKARRGELLSKGPMGYLRTENTLILEPDEQARSVIRLVFEQFNRLGSMHAVLRNFVAEGIRLPVRESSGLNKGQLAWRRPNQTAIKNILSHPIYAGAFVFGRSCQSRKARQSKRPSRLPRSEWMVLLRDRYPAYISWAEYEENQVRLEHNRSLVNSRCSVRAGRALLAGMVVCGRCGHRLRTRYGGANAKPCYRCTAAMSLYGESNCQGLSARELDDEVVRLAMKALEPSALAVSLHVTADLGEQRAAAEKLWEQRLERAAYEAERAARQYHAVEPENRLVARTLELTWEEKLRALRLLEEQRERFRQEQPQALTLEDQERIRRLALDVPALWNAAGTTDVDRKEILREIIDRVVVNVEGESEWVEVWVHWIGGHKTYTRFHRSVASWAQLSTGPALLRRIRELLNLRLSASKIAERLNAEGFRTARGKSFKEPQLRTLLLREGLSSLRRPARRPEPSLGKDEWLIGALARKIQVGYGTIHRWIGERRLAGRKEKDGRWIVVADEAKCRELSAKQSSREQRRKTHEAASATVVRSGHAGSSGLNLN